MCSREIYINFYTLQGMPQPQKANLSKVYIPSEGVQHPKTGQYKSIKGLVILVKQGTSLRCHYSSTTFYGLGQDYQ